MYIYIYIIYSCVNSVSAAVSLSKTEMSLSRASVSWNSSATTRSSTNDPHIYTRR